MCASKIKAAMFDLDGTLLDTIEDLMEAMNTALSDCGLPVTTDVEKHFHFVGDGVDNYILRAMPEDRRGDTQLLAKIRDIYRRLYAAGWQRNSGLYDGILQMLTDLAKRGVALSVLSNKPDNFTREMVSHFLPDVNFALVRGAMDGVPLKPDPAAAIEIARRMDFTPEQFIYLGDTATDMKTAVAAGFFAVGCLWGFRKRDELENAGAMKIISHPSEFALLV